MDRTLSAIPKNTNETFSRVSIDAPLKDVQWSWTDAAVGALRLPSLMAPGPMRGAVTAMAGRWRWSAAILPAQRVRLPLKAMAAVNQAPDRR